MSLSPGTILEVIELVQFGVKIYKKIKDGPEVMKKLGRRMERLNSLLVDLESHVKANSKTALARLRKGQTQEFSDIIEETKLDCGKANDLFYKWENNIGPWGIQWRFTSFAQALFSVGWSSDKVEALAADIEIHRRDIDQYMGFMGIVYGQANFAGIKKLQEDNQALKKQLAEIAQMLKDGKLAPAEAQRLTESLKPQPKTPDKAQAKDKNKRLPVPKPKTNPSPSPGPASEKKDFKVLFVDPTNAARSVTAGTLVKLLMEWTTRTGGDWRIKEANSAGFFVKNKCNIVKEIENLKYSRKAWKIAMVDGDAKPNPTAAAALFDNKTYDYPFKQTIKSTFEKRGSIGLKRHLFQYYDYIMVFTAREHDNMIVLKQALVEKDGKDMAPKGKGRVLHLGRYLTLDGIPREIVDPKAAGGTGTREEWNFKVSQIKTAVKAFLKQEFGWKQPDAKTPVKS
jgi:protein-tyrosine-phosphatase